MTLEDVLECTAVANHALQLANQTFLVQAMWKFTAQSVKISTIQDPNIKAVSFYLHMKTCAFELKCSPQPDPSCQ